jgi:hypothetical protein
MSEERTSDERRNELYEVLLARVETAKARGEEAQAAVRAVRDELATVRGLSPEKRGPALQTVSARAEEARLRANASSEEMQEIRQLGGLVSEIERAAGGQLGDEAATLRAELSQRAAGGDEGVQSLLDELAGRNPWWRDTTHGVSVT